MTNRKVVIIGGSGFIGTVLTRQLLELGYTVVIGDKEKSKMYPDFHQYCDVRDIESLRQVVEGAFAVYNLAAEHRDDVMPRSLYYDVNVDGARNLCKASGAAGINRILFTSSVAVYGFVEDAVDEKCAFNPFNDYGKSKAEAEQVLDDWRAADPARSVFVVRPTVVFGEGNRGNVYNLLRQLSSGFFPMIGNGRNRKSLAYVENLAAFLVHGLHMEDKHSVYNYADKPDLDMNSLVLQVKRSLGQQEKIGLRIPYAVGLIGGWFFDALAFVARRKFAISAIRIKKFCANSCYICDRVSASGFQAPISLSEGLDRTIRKEFVRQ